MKSLKVDIVMLYFMVFILVIILSGYFLAPDKSAELGSFLHMLTILCVLGISSFFFLKKGDFFRNNFLFAYLGTIVWLIIMNVLTIVSGDYDNILVKVIILMSLVSFFIYPFFKDKNSLINGIHINENKEAG